MQRLRAAGMILAMMASAAWAHAPTSTASPEIQVLQLIQKIQGVLKQRNAGKVPRNTTPFSAQFYATNARCQAYLNKLTSFAALRGQLTDAFVGSLSEDELKILRQDEATLLAAVDCPPVTQAQVAATNEQLPAPSLQPPTAGGNQTSANPPVGEQPTPSATQSTPQAPTTAPATPPARDDSQTLEAGDGGEIKGGSQTIYLSAKADNYQIRLGDPSIDLNTKVDLNGQELPVTHHRSEVRNPNGVPVIVTDKNAVVLKLEAVTDPDPNNPTKTALVFSGVKNSLVLHPSQSVVLHISGTDPTTHAPVVKTATVSVVLLEKVQFPSEIPVKPTELHFNFDIVRLSSVTGAKGQCSNRAYSQDAQIWQTIIRLRPTKTQDTDRPENGIFVYKGNTPGIRYLAVFEDFQPTASLSVGARAFDGSLTRMLSGELRVTFANRSLTETSDLLKELSSHSDVVMSRIAGSLGKLSVYQVATDPSLDAQLESTLFGYLESQQAVGNNIGKISSLAAPLTAPGAARVTKAVVAVTGQGTTLPLNIQSVEPMDVGSLKLVAGDLAPLNAAIQKLANKGLGTNDPGSNQQSTTTNTGIQSAGPTQPSGSAGSTSRGNQKNASGTTSNQQAGKSLTTGEAQNGQKQQVILIQDDCVEVSVEPNLSGSDFQPSVFVKAHYDYVTSGNYFVFKNYAEGEGSGSTKDFQRLAFSSEGMTLRAPTGGGWTFNGGVVGRFNRSLKLMEINEWQTGGKFVVQTPFIPLPGASAGANTKPTIDADAVASSNGLANQGVNFLAHANFTYSYRTGRFTVDGQSNNGWSNQKYFAGRSQYSYALLQLRFNLKNDLDYSAKYECGRKPPNYEKSCGWKTGFSFVTGR